MLTSAQPRPPRMDLPPTTPAAVRSFEPAAPARLAPLRGRLLREPDGFTGAGRAVSPRRYRGPASLRLLGATTVPNVRRTAAIGAVGLCRPSGGRNFGVSVSRRPPGVRRPSQAGRGSSVPGRCAGIPGVRPSSPRHSESMEAVPAYPAGEGMRTPSRRRPFVPDDQAGTGIGDLHDTRCSPSRGARPWHAGACIECPTARPGMPSMPGREHGLDPLPPAGTVQSRRRSREWR